MRIVLTGGGTGGHVTPLKPILKELKRLDPSVETMFIAQKGDRFADLIEVGSEVDEVVFISAGKYRRFPDEAMWQRVIDLQTHALNIRDLFLTLGAMFKSRRIMRKYRPDVVFGNGGYVSVPVGWAAHNSKIPLVIHESDARAGLATRLLTSRANRILFGVPTETTTIGNKAAEYIGIPLRDEFIQKEKLSKAEIKEKLGFDPDRPLVTIAGSSLGAEAINNAVTSSISQLIKSTQVAHITGAEHHSSVVAAVQDSGVTDGYQAFEFVNNIDMYFKASDVVVNRASATIFTELAALGKATILIPAPQLSDQVENAQILGDKGVVEIIDQTALEDGPELLATRISALLDNDAERRALEVAIAKLAKPDAGTELAKILLSFGERSRG